MGIDRVFKYSKNAEASGRAIQKPLVRKEQSAWGRPLLRLLPGMMAGTCTSSSPTTKIRGAQWQINDCPRGDGG